MAEPPPKDHSVALISLLKTYNDLNHTSSIEYLPQLPSALEFSRIVNRNRPVIIRNAFKDWPAMGAEGALPERRWTAEYLAEQMEEQPVQVAVTKRG